MKAILVGKNRELTWSDVPNPIVGDEDVLVKIEYAALNRADLMQRAGDYPPPPGCPEWMGLDKYEKTFYYYFMTIMFLWIKLKVKKTSQFINKK